MTDAVNLGALVSDEGYFLQRRPRVAARPFTANRADRDPCPGYRHVFSYPHSVPAIHEAVLELLASAREKVFLASFFVGEPELLEALYAAAQRMQGGVYVISALDERSLRQGLAMTEAADAPDAADFRAHNKQFADMTNRGIAVRGHENCHAKFMIVDDRVAIVSSANLETAALVGTAERAVTGENGVVVSAPAEVARLSRFFTRLWYSCRFEMPPGDDHTVQERTPAPSPCAVPVPSVAATGGVIWTHDDEQVILATMHDVIARAHERVLLSTFSLNGMRSSPELLLEPLRRAIAERGPSIALLARARNNNAAHRLDAQALADLGVVIYADAFNHAKGVIADGRHGALFSANFDAQHGLTSGVEVGVRLDGEAALEDAVAYFNHAIDHADLIFAARPSQSDLDRGLEVRWRKRWRLEAVIRATTPAPVWNRFCSSAATGPVLFSEHEEGHLLLYAGKTRWRLGPIADGLRTLNEFAGDREEASTVLKEWESGSRRTKGATKSSVPSGRKGFCPAVVHRA